MLIMLMHGVLKVNAIDHREARGKVKKLKQPFGPNLHRCKDDVHRYAKAPPPYSSRQVFFSEVSAPVAYLYASRARRSAHAVLEGLSTAPIASRCHSFPLLCEFSLPLRTLEGPQNKKKKKNPRGLCTLHISAAVV